MRAIPSAARKSTVPPVAGISCFIFCALRAVRGSSNLDADVFEQRHPTSTEFCVVCELLRSSIS
eukprot:6211960-Pleurochrysis_carterae.AAC.5